MSITIDIQRAREVFVQAVALVDAGVALPVEWTHRVQQVGRGPSKTFVAMLGTALLSRATDPRADPFTLKAGAEAAPGFESYSARAVATAVLAPMAVEHMVDIGTRGREPLNNQPFFRYTRVEATMVVRERARPHLLELIEALDRIMELPEAELLPALAAFVAVRRRSAKRPVRRMRVASNYWTINEFVHATGDFVTGWAEEGKRGQALVASSLDLVLPFVDLGHVNDPGRRMPGDVHAYHSRDDTQPTLSAEVKQKPATRSDVLHWSAALSEASISRGIYVMLAPAQEELELRQLTEQVLLQHNVLIGLYPSAFSFVREAMIWSGLDLHAFMLQFPQRMYARLEESGVSLETLDQWDELFGT